jgi:antitoxin ParD1/3/4
MASENINVRITGELRNHLEQQISNKGFYENAGEYVRSLIRSDLKSSEKSWEWLRKELEPVLRADESEFVEVSARDVIARKK